LEQLDRVPRRILEQDLPASGAGHDLVAKADAGTLRARDLSGDLLDDEVDPVPAVAGSRFATSGIGLPAELSGPASSSRSRPRTTSANAGSALDRATKPNWPMWKSIASWTSSTI